MKHNIFLAIGISTMLLVSCTTYQYSARQTSIERQDFSTTPTIVDVRADYSKRIEVVSNWHPKKEDAINECRYMAITDKKIDVVVDPIIKIQYRAWKSFSKYKVTLIGFAGYYVNPRTIYEDMELLQKFTCEDIEKYLLLHDSSILKYMNAKSDVINIYHENSSAVQPAPAPQTAEQEQTAAAKQKDKNKAKRK